MKKRKDIDEKYKWDFSCYYSNDEDWLKNFDEYSLKLNDIKSFAGKLNNKDDILKCFKLLEQLDLMAEPLYIYANCLRDVDVSNSNYQILLNKIESKYNEQSVLSSFISPELSSLSVEFLNSLLDDENFIPYKKILKEIIKEKPHILSKDCEEILSQVGSFSRDFGLNFSNFENGDLKFNKIKNGKGKILPMNQSLASQYLRDKDVVLRENAYIELHSAFGRFNNFLTSNYLGNVKKDVFYAKTKKFKTALDAALFYEDVDSLVYNRLLSTVENHLSSEHKYFQLKQKLLKLKTFKLSDVYFNPIKSGNKYTYEEGFNIVLDALSLLGSDYTSYLKKLKDTNRIDVFPNENKYNGAYKTGAYSKSPMVLLNFNGSFDDVSTIAHELGHAMHSVYSDENQSLYDANYTIFLAEIASTVNETILNDYMLSKTDDKKEKLFYICEFLSRFHATVYRQTMFADFENKIHTWFENGQPLSCEVLNNEYLSLVKKYFGKKVKILTPVQYEWSRIPHFYTSFYVYKYATGLISAINIVENLKTGKITVEDYKKFLSSGCTSDPISLLKIVKVDLSTDEPFEKAFNILDSYLSKFEELL